MQSTDLDATMQLITEACAHYEKSAPTVERYLDDLYIRVNENADSVVLSELLFVGRLREEGEWMHPNYAANGVYKLLVRLGRDTTGQAGF